MTLRSSLSYVLCGVLFLSLHGAAHIAAAAVWAPTPSDPVLDPGSIKIGGGLSLGPGGTLVLQKGEQVTISAVSKDTDKKTDGSTVTHPADSGTVNWTKSGGTLGATTTNSGQSTTYTAPNTTGSYTLTATPDDKPDPIPSGDSGNRNDAPGSGVTINIKVIDDCPTDISLAATCSVPTNWATFWAANWPGLKTWGFTTAKHTVSGGTPPNPPNNWNGLFIEEALALHPVNSGTATDADLNGTTKAQVCTATVQGFIVGASQGAFQNCSRAAADDSFWDDHATAAGSVILNGGVGTTKTVICKQEYFCNGTKLKVGTNDRFKLTRTFTNKSYVIGGAARTVTEVPTTKAAD